MENPSEIWSALEQRHPPAARLAVISSIPVRVSPAFLRMARLRLVVDGNTGNEADLWLSDLVETRSAAGFSFLPEVRTYLRQRLAADSDLLDRVWWDVHTDQAQWLPPKMRLEEELTWRLLRDHRDSWIEAQWLSVWQEMERGENAEGVARWVVRALPEMPVVVFESEAASKVWIAAHLLLGDTSVLGEEPQRFVETGEFEFATSRLPRRRIHIGLSDKGIIVSPLRSMLNGHEIDVPSTRPLWLQIETENSEALQVLTIAGTEPVEQVVDASPLLLRLIDGSSYRLLQPEVSQSGRFVKREGPPRTRIEYEIEIDGVEKSIELPFVIGVLADLSGDPLEFLPPVADRKFIEVDADNFDPRGMAALQPRLSFSVPDMRSEDGGEIKIALSFKSMADFSPDSVARQVPTLSEYGEYGEGFSAQLNRIIHHEAFQRLEGSWRGLSYLVSNTETDETLKIRVLNISKAELSRELKKYTGESWEQSPLFKKIYEEEFGMFGGQPYGCLVGDYFFDHSPQDVELLRTLARIAAAAHAPFIAGAAPAIMQLDSWQELSAPRDLQKVFMTPEHVAWRSLRESEDARYICLTLPRFLSRLPYGANTIPLEGFDFEEESGDADHSGFTWSNTAYLMAANIARAFKKYGWTAQIRGVESGGLVEGLPTHTFANDDGEIDMKCPTEIAITDRREAELNRSGFTTLVHYKNTDYAVFFSAGSIQTPTQYEEPEANANAALATQLPYLFALCRFVQYLKCMVRDKIGSFRSREDMEKWLNAWIMNYVDTNPDSSSAETKARRPLASAEVVIDEPKESTAYYPHYHARVYLQPHYQLSGLTVSLRMTTRLPSPGKMQ